MTAARFWAAARRLPTNWRRSIAARFVKLFLTGLEQAATGLSGSGLAIFELVYNAVRERPGQRPC